MARQYRNRDNPGLSRRILSIRVRREVDDSPDLSYLGEYSSRAGNNCVDRAERGDMERGEHRYFNAAMSADDTGNPSSVEQDYRRMEAYNRGDWYMVGIWAEAEVQLGGTVVQTIRSGGLWGVESDSGDYLDEVANDELTALSVELGALGFTQRQIDAALREAVRP